MGVFRDLSSGPLSMQVFCVQNCIFPLCYLLRGLSSFSPWDILWPKALGILTWALETRETSLHALLYNNADISSLYSAFLSILSLTCRASSSICTQCSTSCHPSIAMPLWDTWRRRWDFSDMLMSIVHSWWGGHFVGCFSLIRCPQWIP